MRRASACLKYDRARFESCRALVGVHRLYISCIQLCYNICMVYVCNNVCNEEKTHMFYVGWRLEWLIACELTHHIRKADATDAASTTSVRTAAAAVVRGDEAKPTWTSQNDIYVVVVGFPLRCISLTASRHLSSGPFAHTTLTRHTIPKRICRRVLCVLIADCVVYLITASSSVVLEIQWCSSGWLNVYQNQWSGFFYFVVLEMAKAIEIASNHHRMQFIQ